MVIVVVAVSHGQLVNNVTQVFINLVKSYMYQAITILQSMEVTGESSVLT